MELPVQNLGKREAGIGFAVARIFADRFLKEIGGPSNISRFLIVPLSASRPARKKSCALLLVV